MEIVYCTNCNSECIFEFRDWEYSESYVWCSPECETQTKRDEEIDCASYGDVA